MTHLKKVSGVAFSAAFSILLACARGTAVAAPLTECVGRVQVDFPGPVEVATVSLKTMEAEYRVHSPQPRYEFQDGQEAGWSSIQTPERFLVTSPLPTAERERMLKLAKNRADKTKLWAKSADAKKNFELLPLGEQKGVAAHVGGSYDWTLVVGDSIVRSWFERNQEWSGSKKKLDSVLAGIRSREIGDSPAEDGICLPYAFIRDATPSRSYVGTTYRLREHPDLTVWILDRNAEALSPELKSQAEDPTAKSDVFWSNYMPGNVKDVKSVWSEPYRKVTVAGSNGVESFVRIRRSDGAVDAGYLMVTRGNPEASIAGRDLMLYVIQDSRNAVKNGIEPVSAEAFLRTAKSISSSVRKLRP